MTSGIIIFGAPGSGQTTIGSVLAQQLNYPHFDLDDYHWRWDTEIPYTIMRSAEERTEHLMSDILKQPNFVMSGSMWSIRKPFEPLFDFGVFVTVPAEIRAERIKTRVRARWGRRVLPGGDMYEANAMYRGDFLDVANAYGKEMHEQHKQWISELPCPVLHIDGTLLIEESVAQIIERYSK